MGILAHIFGRIIGARGIKKAEDTKCEELKKNLVSMLKEFNSNINEDLIMKKIKKLNFYFTNEMKTCEACFHPASNSIFVDKNIDLSSPVLFHEFIHSLDRKVNSKNDKFSSLEEGFATEMMLLRDGNQYSNGEQSEIMYNFSIGAYQNETAIVRQIEKIMEVSICETDYLVDHRKFFKDFSKNYGNRTLRKLQKSLYKLNNSKDYIKDFSKIQNDLLTRVFDKDFKQINSLEDATQYLQRLNAFEEERVRIPGDSSFKDYYYSKRNKLIEKYAAKGYSPEILNEQLKQYVKTPLKPNKMVYDVLHFQVALENFENISRKQNESNVEIYNAFGNDDKSYFIIKNGKRCTMIKYDDFDCHVQHRFLSETTKDELSINEENNKAIIDGCNMELKKISVDYSEAELAKAKNAKLNLINNIHINTLQLLNNPKNAHLIGNNSPNEQFNIYTYSVGNNFMFIIEKGENCMIVNNIYALDKFQRIRLQPFTKNCNPQSILHYDKDVDSYILKLDDDNITINLDRCPIAEEKVNKSVMQNAKEIEQNPHQKSIKDLSNPNDIQRGMELF